MELAQICSLDFQERGEPYLAHVEPPFPLSRGLAPHRGHLLRVPRAKALPHLLMAVAKGKEARRAVAATGRGEYRLGEGEKKVPPKNPMNKKQIEARIGKAI